MKAFFLLLLIPFLFLTSCSINDNPTEDSYSFLQVTNYFESPNAQSEITCPMRLFDGPRYSYSKEENSLDIYNPINITKDTKFLVATWNGVSLPDAGGAVGLVNAYSSSAVAETIKVWSDVSNDIVKIHFDKNTVHLKLNDTLSFTLNQGESREFNFTYPGTNTECSYNITRTLAFRNYGAIPVKNVRCNNN